MFLEGIYHPSFSVLRIAQGMHASINHATARTCIYEKLKLCKLNLMRRKEHKIIVLGPDDGGGGGDDDDKSSMYVRSRT
jgi:hypothetical protein